MYITQSLTSFYRTSTASTHLALSLLQSRTSTAMSPRDTELDKFFPLPSAAPSNRSPARLSGFTHKSGEALVKVLQDDHIKWHAFFNDKGFHK